MILLKAEKAGAPAGYWTGMAGYQWVSPERAKAFQCSPEYAAHKLEQFNQRTALHGLRFSVEAV